VANQPESEVQYSLMARYVAVVAVIFVLGANTRAAVAQVRTASANGQRAAVAGHIDRAVPAVPSTAPRSVQTLRFEPPPPNIGHLPVPLHAGRRIMSFGVVTWWPWSGVTPTLAGGAPAVLVPPLDGVPLGGVQLDVQPWQAHVYVDGAYAGIVENFKGYYDHLELVPGSHVITIVAPDYDPLTFDVMVAPGRTTTYRGVLTWAAGR
jgi:hypothetical protein